MIIITGASRGIGFHIADILLSKGYEVLKVSKHSKNANERVDITNKIDCIKYFNYLKNNNIKIDAVINNAGIQTFVNILNTNIELIKRDINTNLLGTIQFTNYMIPLLNDNAKIINVTTSSLLNEGMLDYFGYLLSKQGLVYYTQLLSKKLPDKYVVAVCPGWCNTDMAGNSPKSARKGADEIVWLIENDIVSGSFYSNKNIL